MLFHNLYTQPTPGQKRDRGVMEMYKLRSVLLASALVMMLVMADYDEAVDINNTREGLFVDPDDCNHFFSLSCRGCRKRRVPAGEPSEEIEFEKNEVGHDCGLLDLHLEEEDAPTS